MTAEIFSLAPFDSGSIRFTEHDHFETRYWVYGQESGQPLLLVHGFRGDHHGLEFIAQALTRLGNYRVIVPDLPGFGLSKAGKTTQDLDLYTNWLGSFAQAFDLEDFQLVGHSFGSIVCAHALADQLLKPQTLTLINPICEPPLDGQNRLAAAGAEFYYWLGANLPEKAGNALLKNGLITRLTSEFMMKTKNQTLRKFINNQHASYFSTFNTRQGLLEAFQTSVTHHVAQVASSLELPVLTIVGEKDDLGSVLAQENLVDQMPHSKMILITDVGHLIHYEAPVRAAQAIHNFLTDSLGSQA